MKRFFVRWDALWPGIGIALVALAIATQNAQEWANVPRAALASSGMDHLNSVIAALAIGIAIAVVAIFTRSALLRLIVAALWVTPALWLDQYAWPWGASVAAAVCAVFSFVDSWPRSPKGTGRRWSERNLTVRTSIIMLLIMGLLVSTGLALIFTPGIVVSTIILFLGKLPDVPGLKRGFEPVPGAAPVAATTDASAGDASTEPTATPEPATSERAAAEPNAVSIEDLMSKRQGQLSAARALGIATGVGVVILAIVWSMPFSFQNVFFSFFLGLCVVLPLGISAIVASVAAGETGNKIADLEAAAAAANTGTPSGAEPKTEP